MIEYIKRDLYLERIVPYIGKPVIKVLSGQRRVGKSYILIQLCDKVRELDSKANVICINCELEEFRKIRESSQLYEYVSSKLARNRNNYLFIDEVQEVDSFQDALRSLLAEGACDIYCTGSNAKMLSGELATYLSGRYMEFDVHSLSYKEFLQFHKLENSQDSLVKYLTYGGMPFLVNLELNSDQVFEYLSNVYSTILFKDVVEREKIRNISFLENLILYVSDNLGSLFSANNISKYLKNQKINISPQLVINYLKSLTNSYIIHRVQRANLGGLKIFEVGEKYYFEDLGLRNTVRGAYTTSDLHKLMENAVYLHLLQCGYRVFIGKLNDKVIDFMAHKSGQRIYVQVALTAMDVKTRDREFGNLLLVSDNFPKYVVTLNDTIIGDNYKGIFYCNLAWFLIEVG